MAFDNTQTALRQIGGLTVQRLSQGLKESNSDASGELDKSIGFKIRSSSKKIELNIEMLEYWSSVNYGQDPNVIFPLDQIKEWLTYPNVRDKIRLGQSDAQFTESALNSAAYLISRKIWNKGTKGTDFATNVFTSNLITKELPEVLTDAIAEDADAILADLLERFK